MRTTLTIDDDLLRAAKAIAQARAVSIGTILSELARKGLAAPAGRKNRNGLNRTMIRVMSKVKDTAEASGLIFDLPVLVS
jgi:hypothetical protein